jgi:hypocretin (orexin) receptor 2
MTLTFISVERYFAIVHPLKFRATIYRTRVTICAIWVVSCVLLVPELVVLDVHRRWPPEFTRLLTVCRPSWPADRQTAYQLVLLVVLYGLPLVMMAFAYVQIARRLWTSLAMEPLPDSPSECC